MRGDKGNLLGTREEEIKVYKRMKCAETSTVSGILLSGEWLREVRVQLTL